MGVKVNWLCCLGKGATLRLVGNPRMDSHLSKVLGLEGLGTLGICSCTFAPHQGTALGVG